MVLNPSGVAITGSWDSDVVHLNYKRELQNCRVVESFWKVRPQWVIVPYTKRAQSLRSIPSNAGTEQAGVNLRGPPRKPKYSLVTESEPVP